MHPFRSAVEAGDIEAAVALLAPDIVFNSPIVFSPYHGREPVSVVLRAAFEVLEGLRYEREIGAPDARDHALMFRAHVGDREVQGCDFIHTGEDGRITEFTVMVRPLSGANALAVAMKDRLERMLSAGA